VRSILAAFPSSSRRKVSSECLPRPARRRELRRAGLALRKLPLSMRKTNLARLLARGVDSIHLAPFEQGEIGPDLFRHACLMGLEGIPRRSVRSLDQGQEPAASGVRQRPGSVRLGCVRPF
jgi:hypothetical protein